MKIVLVSKEFPPSSHSYGIGTYTAETAKSLTKTGHQVTVICAADAIPPGETTREGVRVVRLADREFERRSLWAHLVPPRSVRAYRKRVAEALDRIVSSGDADIVEFPGFRGESAVWTERLRRIPMVVRLHGFTAWVDKTRKDYISAARRQLMNYETTELLRADRVTLVADHLRAAVERKIPRDKVTTIHNGIDARLWAERGVSQRAPDVNSCDILFVGSLTKVKGVFTLIEAAEKLYMRGSLRGRLILAGRSGKEFEHYRTRRWGKGAALPPYIDLRGHVSRMLLPAAYRSAAVCCFPSYLEPFSYTALEATASGGLLVGSCGTGTQELIMHGESGYLVEPGDPDRLASVLSHALRLPAETSLAMRRAAQRRTLETCDLDVVTRQLEDLYRLEIINFSCRGVRHAKEGARFGATARAALRIAGER